MIKNSHTLKFAVITLVAMVALTLFFSSCDHGQQLSDPKKEAAIKLLSSAYDVTDYERVIELADSLEKVGDISPFYSAYCQGVSYILLNNIQRAHEVLKSVMDMKLKNYMDSVQYFKCVCRMAELYVHENDYEGVLRVALPAIESMKDLKGEEITRGMGIVNTFVGIAQLWLGMKEEAAKTFDMSYDNLLQVYAANPSWQHLAVVFITSNSISNDYLSFKDYVSAEKWFHRQDSVIALISEREDIPSHEKEDCLRINTLTHAQIALGLNRQEEAKRAFADYQKFPDSKTANGRIDGVGFLLQIGRYAEAANALTGLDQFLAEKNIELSLDAINTYFESKFQANYMAGRRDSALAVAAYVFEHLDSAITKQKKSDAAELATIYKTHEKDAEIAEQQAALSQQRWIGTLVAMVLLTIFFIIYTEYRRRAANRLGEAHVQLQNAYDQLEETTAAKERIESELRIARDIQMSMVPGVFPKREGLDMYAEMSPAREVGGDLYGYVMQGDRLYFCVGDVSGKGVPASLFMAQSARLFRTLAAEGMMPAAIAFRMNKALAENNERGMFVTMFIGMLHLDTGQLDFCNCGHNAPVIDGEFLKMAYDNQPLGLWEDDPFEGETIDDIRGQQLLVYTDGLNEAENRQKELLGNARLIKLMANTVNLSSHEVIDRLKTAVEEHRAGADANDDLTLMCIRLSSKDMVCSNH